MQSRLQQLLIAKGITASAFADEIGVQAPSVSHVLSGRNKPGYDFICKIIERYDDIDPEWLLLGKGNMFKTIEKSSSISNVTQKSEPTSTPNPQSITNVFSNVLPKIETLTNVSNASVSKIVIIYDDNSFEMIFPKA